MTPATTTAATVGRSLRDAVGVVAEKRTYKHLLYLGLAFPIGLLYYVALTFGLAFGVALSIVVVGIAILFGTLLVVRMFAAFERWLANALLGLDLSASDDVDGGDGGFVGTFTGYVDAASTWRGLGFLLTKFWVGLLGFVVLFFLITAASILTAPLRYPHTVEFGTVNDEPVTWAIDTVPEAIVAVPLGALLVVAIVHVANGVAYVCRRMAEALLGDADAGRSGAESAVGGPESAAAADSVAEAGSAGAAGSTGTD